jgi:hypothetical protein
MTKEVAKLLMSISIYPTKEELRGAVESYLEMNHTEFYQEFTEHQWTPFYNKRIHQIVRSFFLFINFLIN